MGEEGQRGRVEKVKVEEGGDGRGFVEEIGINFKMGI